MIKKLKPGIFSLTEKENKILERRKSAEGKAFFQASLIRICMYVKIISKLKSEIRSLRSQYK